MGSSEAVFRNNVGAYLLLLPTLAVVTLFLYYPTLQTFRLSLYKTFLFGQNTEFVGLENFARLLTSADYLQSVIVTLGFAAAVTVGTLVVSILISFPLYRTARGSTLYLLGLIWPYAIPTSVVAVLFLFLLSPNAGLFTHYLNQWFGITLQWYTNGTQAFVLVVLAAIWKQIGFNVIFLIAAFSNVPQSLADQARLDGIRTSALLTRVYLPLIAPTLVFLAIMNSIFAFFESFALIDLLTQGGPNGATNIMIFKLYKDAFEFDNLGLASAESIVLFVVVAVLTVVQLRLSDRYAHFGG